MCVDGQALSGYRYHTSPGMQALGLATRTAFSCCRNERGPISANFWLGVGSPLMPEVVGSDLQALQMERLLLHCVNLRLRRKHGGAESVIV